MLYWYFPSNAIVEVYRGRGKVDVCRGWKVSCFNLKFYFLSSKTIFLHLFVLQIPDYQIFRYNVFLWRLYFEIFYNFLLKYFIICQVALWFWDIFFLLWDSRIHNTLYNIQRGLTKSIYFQHLTLDFSLVKRIFLPGLTDS